MMRSCIRSTVTTTVREGGEGLLADAPDPCNRPDLYVCVDHQVRLGDVYLHLLVLKVDLTKCTLGREAPEAWARRGPRH